MKSALLVMLIVVSAQAFSQQDSSAMIRYSPDFKFKDGIFLSFEQVKQNNPIPKSSIITTVAYDDPDFYDRVLREKKIQVFDNLGTKQEVPIKNLWGFSRNGVLYINLNEGHYRITMIGSICHFVASLTSYNSPYNSYPYYSYGYPYYGYPYNPYYSPYGGTQTSEMRQYLLDFKTGNVLDYDVESVELLLMADPELHDEFSSLNKKKKKQMKFLYIRKFNERNTLYFPKN
ncbi:MAG: hypothetical protein JW830_00450 [Bacteroidales bacterium]|nr:hypothetical protein [Bacteroidales bacterium]